MARDYRYGHKVKKPTVRRTQEGNVHSDDVVSAEPPELVTVKKHKAVESKESKPSVVAEPEVSNAKPSAQESVVSKAKKVRIVKTRSADEQKIIDEACRLSLPKAIRKEAEARELLARQEAKALAQEEEKSKLIVKKTIKSRLNWGVWGALTLLILSGIAWLLYAPFFLAFAFEMKWIDEATRNQLDPAASMRSQVVANVPTVISQEPINVTNSNSASAIVTPDKDVAYSFYNELPKATMTTGAQPLPVRTRAPTYLQLASIANDKDAQAERKRLAQKGYLVQVTAHQVKGQTLYILRMGPYDDQRVINRLKVELQRLGVDAHEMSIASIIKSVE